MNVKFTLEYLEETYVNPYWVELETLGTLEDAFASMAEARKLDKFLNGYPFSYRIRENRIIYHMDD